MVADVVLPVVVTAPGFLFTVQEPDGNPLKLTEPVAKVQVGCVMVPTTGLDGVVGCVFTTTFSVAEDVQPSAFLTVKV